LAVVASSKAKSPNALFCSPVVFASSAPRPCALLKVPVVLLKSASGPKALLKPPLVLLWSALSPTAVLLTPVVLFPSASKPTATGLLPVVLSSSAPKPTAVRPALGGGATRRKAPAAHVKFPENPSPTLIPHSHVVIAAHIAVEALSPTAVLSLPKLLSIIDAVPTGFLKFASVPAPTRLVRARLLRQPRC